MTGFVTDIRTWNHPNISKKRYPLRQLSRILFRIWRQYDSPKRQQAILQHNAILSSKNENNIYGYAYNLLSYQISRDFSYQ